MAVLAYLPKNNTYDFYGGETLFPEGLENVPPKFRIERRNKWMIDQANYCLCYINETFGGAYKFAGQAKRRGLTIINLGIVEI